MLIHGVMPTAHFLETVPKNDASGLLWLCDVTSDPVTDVAGGIMFFGLSVPHHCSEYGRNALKEFLHIWHQYSLGLEGEQITF